MSLVQCTPRHDVVPFSRAMAGIFDDFFSGSPLASAALPSLNIQPSVDIIEENDKVLLKADMPGLDKNDIKVVVDDGLLKVSGNRNETREEKDKGYRRTERFMGTFSRSFRLPSWADGSKVTADYKNGVLTITIPKSEAAKSKQVEVNVE